MSSTPLLSAVYTVEKLYHINCQNCNNHWSESDKGYETKLGRQMIHCPECGIRLELEYKEPYLPSGELNEGC